jgi:hypothetical protein
MSVLSHLQNSARERRSAKTGTAFTAPSVFCAWAVRAVSGFCFLFGSGAGFCKWLSTLIHRFLPASASANAIADGPGQSVNQGVARKRFCLPSCTANSGAR